MNGHVTCLDVTILPAILATEYACDAALGIAMLLAEERDREGEPNEAGTAFREGRCHLGLDRNDRRDRELSRNASSASPT